VLNNRCVPCTLGKYAPQALSHACLDCAAGSYTSKKLGSEKCFACDGGTYSEGLTYNCSVCPSGKYSTTRADKCTLCEKGKYASERATTCKYCDAKYTSNAGSSQCNLAATDYYLDHLATVSTVCPDNAECFGAYQVPVPNNGYWVDRKSYKYMANIHACLRPTCVFNNRNTNDSCWSINDVALSSAASMCDSDSLICGVGSEGPLCNSCKDGYVYESISHTCKVCSNPSHVRTGSWVSGSIILVVLLLVLTIRKGMFIHVDSGSLKVVWVSYQVWVDIYTLYTTVVQNYSPTFFNFPPALINQIHEHHNSDYHFMFLESGCELPVTIL
jgi:uncharacterized protein (DUF983 family)